MSFDEVRFPEAIALGATGGPEFRTTVVVTAGGFERRNAEWSAARGRWDVGSGAKEAADTAALIAFFRAREGMARGFRFRDWSDYRATGQSLGAGTGALTTFQLVKRYASGAVTSVRTITKPVSGTVAVFLDDVEQESGWSVNTATGVVTFGTAPGDGVAVTADFEFDVPVRFDTDRMEMEQITPDVAQWGAVPLVELRP